LSLLRRWLVLGQQSGRVFSVQIFLLGNGLP
jgi:alcohol dehydrogenase, propanol-preferring